MSSTGACNADMTSSAASIRRSGSNAPAIGRNAYWKTSGRRRAMSALRIARHPDVIRAVHEHPRRRNRDLVLELRLRGVVVGAAAVHAAADSPIAARHDEVAGGICDDTPYDGELRVVTAHETRVHLGLAPRRRCLRRIEPEHAGPPRRRDHDLVYLIGFSGPLPREERDVEAAAAFPARVQRDPAVLRILATQQLPAVAAFAVAVADTADPGPEVLVGAVPLDAERHDVLSLEANSHEGSVKPGVLREPNAGEAIECHRDAHLATDLARDGDGEDA